MFSRVSTTRLREKNLQGILYKAPREKSSGLRIQKGCTLLGQLACFYLMDRVASFPSLLLSQGSSEPISDTLWHIFHALIWHCLTFLPLFFLYLLLHFILFFPPHHIYPKYKSSNLFVFKPGEEICRLASSRRRQWHPAPVLLPGKSHGWRSLEGWSP